MIFKLFSVLSAPPVVKYYVTEFANSYAFAKVWGDFSEATPVRKEVDDAVLIHCTGLILFSEHMTDSLVFFAEKCKITCGSSFRLLVYSNIEDLVHEA